jgi:hypothetical protein
LEEPLSRFDVTAVFHGHAPKGKPEGRTATGIPVYNVAQHVLQTCYPDRPPYRLLEVRTDGEVVTSDEGAITERRHRGRRSSDRVPVDG